MILLFSSKTLSPIPYFPSQPVDMHLIVKMLKLKNNQMVIDLGAGDGIVIFSAAQQSYKQKLNTKFLAVEINPILILILHLRRLFHPNKKNIKIIRDDIFTMDYSRLTINNYELTIYLYISPWYLEKTILNVKNQIPKFSVVSYMYPVKSMKKKESFIQGKNKIFIY
jgi:16S rRNA A1518/A1519 N6-dimethyltransferase RsmA/KsgA/DIM1 with predicted DNA glycosylase/AP lyase activity